MNAEKPSSQQKLQGANISISRHEQSRLLEIVCKPLIGFEFVFFVIIFVIMLVFSDNTLLTSLLAFFLILVVFAFGLEKKRFVSVFDFNSGKVVVEYQSLWFPKLNSGVEEVQINEIEQVGLRRHIKRSGDVFELFITSKRKETLLSGADLSFPDSQLLAETLRETLGLKTPIKAEG